MRQDIIGLIEAALTLRDAQAVLAAQPFAGVVGGELTKFHQGRAELFDRCENTEHLCAVAQGTVARR